MSAAARSSGTTLELHIDELLLDLSGVPGLDEVAARHVLQEALVKLAERLERTPPSWSGEERHKVRLDSLVLEALPSEAGTGGLRADVLAEALHARLLGGIR